MSFKNFIKSCLYYGGAYSFYRLRERGRGTSLLCIMYHQLIPDQSPPDEWWNDGVHTQSQFAAHVEFLKQHFRLISLEEAMDELKSIGHWRARSAAITFDDGYRSVYDLGQPILQHHEVPATVYLPSAFIDRTFTPWWLDLLECLKHWDPATLPLTEIEEFMELPQLAMASSRLDTKALRPQLYSALRRHLRQTDDTTAHGKIKSLKSRIPNASQADLDEWFMDWDQVREMMSARVRFGAHTRTHVNLAHTDTPQAKDEIRGSKQDIEREIFEPVTGFAYPYGMDVDAYSSLTNFLSQIGFHYAVTAAPGLNSEATNPYLLRRITLPCTTQRPVLAHEISTT